VLAATELAQTTSDTIVFNIMDVCIIKLFADVPYTPALPDQLGRVHVRDTVSPTVGDEVFKVGAATGITEGRIGAIRMRLSLPRSGGNPAWLKGMFEVEGKEGNLFSQPGDSGSLIFKRNDDATVDAVGMILGSLGLKTYGFPIQPVLETYRCRLFTGSRGRESNI
jgi:hypothetical protein